MNPQQVYELSSQIADIREGAQQMLVRADRVSDAAIKQGLMDAAQAELERAEALRKQLPDIDILATPRAVDYRFYISERVRQGDVPERF
jgi:hypothetical protein